MQILFIISVIISVTTVVCFLRMPLDAEVQLKDDVYIHMNEGERTRRSADDEVLHPETYDFDLSVETTKLHVHLTRNDNLRTNVPTLALTDGSIKDKTVQDNEESIFYQDIKNGAVFVVQEDETRAKNMFGVFHVKGQDYILQTTGRNKTISFGSNYNRFQIFKEQRPNITFNDIVRSRIKETSMLHDVNVRKKRAAGSYKLELLIVTDYSVYQYWYDKSTKPTALERETDALLTVRQFYAFVINGMDAMYKNIQTTAYTMTIVFAGITIAQTPSDSSWTETIVLKSVVPYQVDSSNGLSNFRTWIQGQSNLPGHDHAMLFTRYDLTASGSTGNAGLAYVGVVCTSSSQSIVEDHFNFIMLTVASHELGHSLSAAHDGVGNACSLSDANIMAASSSPQSGSTATNPWKFSTCSTTYFTTYIDSLETSGTNCMNSLSSSYNSSALSQYANDKPGQVYNADAQCENIQGPGSYFCNDRYSGDFSTICTIMWCSIPSQPGYCSTTVAADGTLCGDKRWCVSGVCTYNATAPSGNSACLYGDQKGQVFSNQPWNCSDVAIIAPINCPNVATKCCASCAPFLPSTTTNSGATISGTTQTTQPLSTSPTTTITPQVYDIEVQCASARGNGSFMCRSLYNGNFASICTTLWCSSPTNSSVCYSATASDGTSCGNKKWCVSGICTSSAAAPAGYDSCLYGDRFGPIFTNNWTCAQMFLNSPSSCSLVPLDCCGSCGTYTTTSSAQTTTLPLLTTTVSLSSSLPPTTYSTTTLPSSTTTSPSTTRPPSTTTLPPTTSLPPSTTTLPHSSTLIPTTSTSHPTTTLPPPTSLPPSSSTLPPSSSSLPPTTSTSHPTTTLPPPTSLPPSSSTLPPSSSSLPPTTSTSHATTTLPPPTSLPPSTTTLPPSSSTIPSSTTTKPLTVSSAVTITTTPGATTTTTATTTAAQMSSTTTQTFTLNFNSGALSNSRRNFVVQILIATMATIIVVYCN